MTHRVLNDNLGRSLHSMLYSRIKAFCERYSPGFPSDAIATNWLSRVYANDLNVHILVDFDHTSTLVGHAVIEVQSLHNRAIIHCYQTQHDNPDLERLQFGLEYMDKLVLEHNALCSVIIAQEHARALTHLGYNPIGTLMVRSHGDVLQQYERNMATFEVLPEETNGMVSLL